MILTLMLYRYLHNLCFSLTFILSHLKLVLILWDTLGRLDHLPDSPIRFSLWITQLLCSPFSANPAKSSFFILPPACSFHTRQCPSRVWYQSPDVLGWWYWGPPLLHAFPLFHFLLFNTPLPNMISSLSLASVSANPTACSFPFTKSESTFQHIPPLEKFSYAFAKRLTSSTKSSFLYLCAVDSLFFFNDTYCSKSLCRSGGFKCWSLFLSLSHGTSVCASANYFDFCSVRST